MDFDAAFDALIGHEGGYVDHPADPGGRTKYGISQRAYPGEDIAALTLQRAKAIYLRDYWGPAGCALVPDALRFELFDAAVNHGVKQAVRLLQRAAGVADDGVIGPATLLALSAPRVDRLRARFNGARLQLMAGLPAWAEFGRGWALRIAVNLLQS
jgi:lysozyme family protein